MSSQASLPGHAYCGSLSPLHGCGSPAPLQLPSIPSWCLLSTQECVCSHSWVPIPPAGTRHSLFPCSLWKGKGHVMGCLQGHGPGSPLLRSVLWGLLQDKAPTVSPKTCAAGGQLFPFLQVAWASLSDQEYRPCTSIFCCLCVHKSHSLYYISKKQNEPLNS